MPEPIDNKGTVVVDGGGSGSGGQGGAGDATVTIKQSELDNLTRDRDNYRTATLGYKKKEDDAVAAKAVADKASADKIAADRAAADAAAGNRGGVIDETKVNSVATTAAEQTLRKANERLARKDFLRNHPDLVDESKMNSVLAELTFKGGEVNVDEINDRLEAALTEHLRKTGKLNEHLDAERERARREGRIEGQFDSARGAGGAGDRSDGGKSTGELTPKGAEMARGMHVDQMKAASVDPSKDNVISVI